MQRHCGTYGSEKRGCRSPRANRAISACQEGAASSCSAEGSTGIKTAWEYPHDLVRSALASPSGVSDNLAPCQTVHFPLSIT